MNDNIAMESLYKTYISNPPKGWEKVFAKAEPELKLVNSILERFKETIHPKKEDIFKALELCPLDQVKVVIIGPEPNHNGTSNGMAFSTYKEHPTTTVTEKIYEELSKEYSLANYIDMLDLYLEEQKKLKEEGRVLNEVEENFISMERAELEEFVFGICPVFKHPGHGDLSEWAKQGVLLLNTCLTVSHMRKGSHKQIWNGVVTRILEAVEEVNPRCIYLLPGGRAKEIGFKIGQRAIKYNTSFPTVGVRPGDDTISFMDSNVFREINETLTKQGKPCINWHLLD